MPNTFLKLFNENKALSIVNKELLVSSLKEYLTFDDLFTRETIVPNDLAELLKKYGWFWVSIDADSSKSRSPHAVVVNDITEETDTTKAQVKYYDVSDGLCYEVNFSDFIVWVKNGVLTKSDLSKVVVRLITAPAKGTL